MFKWSKKDSELEDYYSLKLHKKVLELEKEEEEKKGKSSASDHAKLDLEDPYYKFKKNYSLNKDYEIYLET